MKVKLLKPLHFGGARKEAGSVMDLADPTARELLVRGVAEPAGDLPPPAGPMTSESAAALVNPAAVDAKKGKAHAGK